MGTDGEFYTDGVEKCSCGSYNVKIKKFTALFVDREQGYDEDEKGNKYYKDEDGNEYDAHIVNEWYDTEEDYELMCKDCGKKL